MFHIQERPIAVNVQNGTHQYSQALIQDAADEAFFAALAVFDEIDFSVSTDVELSNWKMGASSHVACKPVPVAYEQHYESRPLKRTFSVASFGSTFGSQLKHGVEADFQQYSSNKKRDPVKNISPCGLRKSVKIDEEELVLLNPGLAQLAAINSSQTMVEECAPWPPATASSIHAPASSSTNHAAAANGHSGETRLRISFRDFGRQGMPVQRFGKSGCIIPDGLSGTHEMYDQPWKFEVRHEQQPGSALVLITWRITNLTSGAVTSVKETPQQATLREFSGRTICNKVVKMALSNRAKELEESMINLKDGSRRQSLENAVRVLKPKLCTVGLLFFGLLHDSVQNKFSN